MGFHFSVAGKKGFLRDSYQSNYEKADMTASTMIKTSAKKFIDVIFFGF